MNPLARLLLAQSVAFAIASVVHSGMLVRVSQDPGATIAEGVIAAVLFGGFVVALVWPNWSRLAAGVAQTFALVGSLIGLYLAARGLGPNTPLDLVFHVVIVLMLVVGLIVVVRGSRPQAASPGRSTS